jgi:hypothetical protein
MRRALPAALVIPLLVRPGSGSARVNLVSQDYRIERRTATARAACQIGMFEKLPSCNTALEPIELHALAEQSEIAAGAKLPATPPKDKR